MDDALASLQENLLKQVKLPSGNEKNALINEMFDMFPEVIDQLKTPIPVVDSITVAPRIVIEI